MPSTHQPIDLGELGIGDVAIEVEIACDTNEVIEKKPVPKLLPKTKSVYTGKRCERTFITFSNEAEFRKAFPIRRAPRVRESRIDPITK